MLSRYVYTIIMVYKLTYSRENKTYEVIVTVKRIKNVIFRYRDGVFYVSAPKLTSQITIYNYLDKFYSRLLAKEAKKTTPFVDGKMYLLGNLVNLHEGQSNGKSFLVGDILLFKNQNDFQRKLRAFAKEYFTSRVRHYEEIMRIKKGYDVKVRDMKTRFGTNSRKTHALSLQLKLIHYHPSIIDAIIIHELAHDRNFNHGDGFYQELYKYCPDYKILLKKLKRGEYS